MELCAPLVKPGGCDTVFVMPNLQPPIKQVSEAVAYHEQLTRLAPGVKFLMSLFLHPGLNADIIAEAARSGVIYGVHPLAPPQPRHEQLCDRERRENADMEYRLNSILLGYDITSYTRIRHQLRAS